MKLQNCLIFIMMGLAHGLYGHYVYPVGMLDAENIVLLYQPSAGHTQIWIWNPITHQAAQALLSTYNPAAIQVLPDGNSLSFIHNDLLYIKSAAKRSPQLLELYEPIHSLGLVNWIDEHHCYLSAQEGKRWNLYQASTFGHCNTIAKIPNVDLLYPQKIAATLFAIERTSEGMYRIVAGEYPQYQQQKLDLTDSFEKNARELELELSDKHPREVLLKNYAPLIYFAEKPIAFLRMINDHEGFVLSHDVSIGHHAEYINCEYFYLKRTDTVWNKTQICTFSIPTYIIKDQSERLYESIVPLLPKFDVSTRTVYYFNSYEGRTALYARGLDQTISQLISRNPYGNLCGLLISGHTCYCGGELSSDGPIKMYFDDQGTVCFELPIISFLT